MAAADDIKKLNEEIASLSRKLGKGTLKVFEPTELREAEVTLRGLRAELSDMEGSATNLYEKLRGVTSEFKGQETATAGIRKAFRSITADATKLKNDEQEIEKLTSKDLKNLQKRVKASQAKIAASSQELINSSKSLTKFQEIFKTKQKEKASQEELNNLVNNALRLHTDLTEEQKAMLASYFDTEGVVGGILDKTQERLDLEEKIDKKVRGFTALSDLAKSIPGLRALAGPFENAEKAARKAAENQQSAFAAGGKALLDSFGPIGFLVTTLKFLKDVAFGISKETTEIGKSMGLSAQNASLYRDTLVDIESRSKDDLITTKNLTEARTQLSNSLGASVRFTEDQLKSQIKLTERIGIQADEAAKIQKLSMLSNESVEDSIKGVNKQVAGLAKSTGIQLDNRDILNEVADTNGQIAATLGNNPGRIAKAVVQVRKFGLSLEKARDIANSLLDFESSISNELEAELLIGRDLNLERARSLSLQGDFAGAAAEVANQVGSLSEFQRMNVIQQQALAQAVGMTVDELSNSLAQTENLNKLGKQNKEQIEAQVASLKQQGRVEEANRLMNSLGNEEDLAAAQNKIDAQTRFNAALDKAKSIFANMFSDSEGFADSLVSVISTLVKMKPLLVTFAAIYATLAIRAQIMALAELTKLSAMTVGIGIAAALAGAAIASSFMNSEKEKIKVDDGVIAPDGGLLVSGPKGSIQLDKDDSIIAGTNLGGGSGGNSELVREIRALRSAMEKGGNVYLDGSKVGEMLSLAQTKH